ncbi:VOC family protein [Mycobacterium paraintracellulare]|uniref:VOC family protein n=1 Tax=Mycobacterium paraintracellulare TaxID=1138383 RepID=UPI0019292A4E|nr:VOC family protein [Mycobacterium paraintracellulare]BCP14197.1 3,4-dihydroxyphenylacetate 2,3-dioxygenase [Mycobacterium paraintracellulare]
MSIQKLSHVHVGVRDIDEALQFHRDTLGLSELSRDGETVFLGCGLDNNFDVALTPGRTGVQRMAFDVTSEDDFDLYSARLADAGIKFELRTDPDPGVAKALQFTLPSGHLMELVTLSEALQYLRVSVPTHPRNVGIAPTDIDHLTIHVDDGRQFIEFMCSVMDFRASDVIEAAPGVWMAGWLHTSDNHHDMAILPPGGEGATLHHVAWTLDGIEHMKRSADLLGHIGVPIEVGPGRHTIGSNLFTYFQAPGGNRYELSAEMGRAANRAADPSFWTAEEFARGFSAWGQVPPEGFQLGS